jgi:putative acetyltransferase
LITIQPIQPAHNNAIATIIKAAFDDFDIPKEGTVYSDPTTNNLYQLFNVPKSYYGIVQNKQQQILGGGGIYPTSGLPANTAELVKFYLHKSSRGLGIGHTLMQHLLVQAKQLGYTQVYLESFPELTAAIHLYKKFGFEVLPNAMGNSGHYACNVWMLKIL